MRTTVSNVTKKNPHTLNAHNPKLLNNSQYVGL